MQLSTRIFIITGKGVAKSLSAPSIHTLLYSFLWALASQIYQTISLVVVHIEPMIKKLNNIKLNIQSMNFCNVIYPSTRQHYKHSTLHFTHIIYKNSDILR